MFKFTENNGLLIDLFFLKVVFNIADYQEPIWTTTSAGGNKTCHIFGMFYERNKYAHVIGFMLLPLLVRFGVLAKGQE